jgi:hypothetical protein
MELIDVTPEDSIVPVYIEKLTAEEQVERDALRQAELDAEEQRKAEQLAKEATRASALAKLAVIGLTQEEIDSL